MHGTAGGPPGGYDVEASGNMRLSFGGGRFYAFGVGARRRESGIASPTEFQISRWSGNHVSMELHLPQ
jgi:hypothetical protein